MAKTQPSKSSIRTKDGIEWTRVPPNKEDSGKFFLVRESMRHNYFCTKLIFEGIHSLLKGTWWTDFPDGNTEFECLQEEHAERAMRWRSVRSIPFDRFWFLTAKKD